MPALSLMPPNSVGAVRIEYLDRFTAESDDADHFEVVDRKSAHLTSVVAQKRAGLHVHSGWFDYTGGHRKLTNVNVDVREAVKATPKQILIVTLAETLALTEIIKAPLESLDELHRDLIGLLGTVLTEDAARRIGLK